MIDVAQVQKTVGATVDGEYGPLTQAAVDTYQRSKGVLVPSWITVAEREFGVHRLASHKTPRILLYGQYTDLKPTSDLVPWCSDFENYIMAMSGHSRTNSAAAASWLNWGVGITKWRYGCVCVFSRVGGHHVTNAVWEDSDSLACLGGNQSSAVNVEVIPKAHLVGMRVAI